jgi:ketosteroid isomerase-like protein
MRSVPLLLCLGVLALPLRAQAPRVARTLPDSDRVAVEQVRREVWNAWYAGDTLTLRRLVAPELVAVSPDAPHLIGRTETMREARRYHVGGGRLEALEFADTQAHGFGDVVVLFSRYAAVATSGGKTELQRGRATEIFVRTGGRWVQTSWHLDVTP